MRADLPSSGRERDETGAGTVQVTLRTSVARSLAKGTTIAGWLREAPAMSRALGAADDCSQAGLFDEAFYHPPNMSTARSKAWLQEIVIIPL